jgi:hypothetical protein
MLRLSFTLRDVFWLTLVVGMGVGWWAQARNHHLKESITAAEIQRLSSDLHEARLMKNGLHAELLRVTGARGYGYRLNEAGTSYDIRVYSAKGPESNERQDQP